MLTHPPYTHQPIKRVISTTENIFPTVIGFPSKEYISQKKNFWASKPEIVFRQVEFAVLEISCMILHDFLNNFPGKILED